MHKNAAASCCRGGAPSWGSNAAVSRGWGVPLHYGVPLQGQPCSFRQGHCSHSRFKPLVSTAVPLTYTNHPEPRGGCRRNGLPGGAEAVDASSFERGLGQCRWFQNPSTELEELRLPCAFCSAASA